MTKPDNRMKPRVLNILTHEPDYRFKTEEPRPSVSWDTADDSWVGIYRNEIPNKLAKEVLAYTDEFIYEVWQPDYRADRIYSHTFDGGETHRLFPAHSEKKRHGLKQRSELYSPAMVDFLKEYSQEHPVILNLNGDLAALSIDILTVSQHIPVLQTFRGTLHLPKTMAFRPRRNFLASVNYLQRHQEVKRVAAHVDYVTYQNDMYYQEMVKLFRAPTAKLTSGCDFSFWKSLDQRTSRAALDLPSDKTILLVSSLLVLRKQVAELIEVLKELDSTYDFLLIVSGHGTEAYEQYLQDIARPLLEKDKARFVGYVTGETLRHYYNSADLFVNPSASEGGPVSAMKALACETPVFSTDSGNVAERMRENGSGILVGVTDFAEWKRVLAEFMEGRRPPQFDREEAESYYDWQRIAAKFAEIYHQLGLRYNLYQPATHVLP